METGVNSFVAPGEIGPLYPFVGTEVILVVVGVLLWIGWHFLHVRGEDKEFKEASELYRRVGLERAMRHHSSEGFASEEERKVAEVYKALHDEEYRDKLETPGASREGDAQGERANEGEDRRSQDQP